MSVSTENCQTGVQTNSSTSATTPSQCEPRSGSRYPPGIQDILDSPSSKYACDSGYVSTNDECGLEVGEDTEPTSISGEADSTKFPRFQQSKVATTTDPCPQEPSVRARSEASVEVERQSIPPRQKAIQTVQNTRRSLGQIRDGLCETIREYFPSRIMIYLLEVPAFKHVRKAINQLIATLDGFEASLGNHLHFSDVNDIEFMMYQIKSALDGVLGGGFDLLNIWNRREGGQEQGRPLTGQNRRFRKILIHNSNEQLDNLQKMVLIADAKIRHEQLSREPGTTRTLNPGKGWGWLKYQKVVSGAFNTSGEAESSDASMH